MRTGASALCVRRASTRHLFGWSRRVPPLTLVGRRTSTTRWLVLCYLTCLSSAIPSIETTSLGGRGCGSPGSIARAVHSVWRSPGVCCGLRVLPTSGGPDRPCAAHLCACPWPCCMWPTRTPQHSTVLHARGGPHSLSAYAITTYAHDAISHTLQPWPRHTQVSQTALQQSSKSIRV